MIATVLALVGMAGVAATPASAATPEQIRACVERNLVRYSTPGSAVVAQYQDIETACRAQLEGDDADVQFTPSGGDAAAPPDADAGTGSPPGSGATAPGQPGAETEPGATPEARRPAATAADVRQAIDRPAAVPAVATPSSASGIPTGLVALLGGIAALLVAGAAIEIRRRAR